jgi:hypothetical protein
MIGNNAVVNVVKGRPGNDYDMAATILFLAGPGGVFYNEQILFPDGGKFIRCVDTAPTKLFAGNTLVQPAAK